MGVIVERHIRGVRTNGTEVLADDSGEYMLFASVEDAKIHLRLLGYSNRAINEMHIAEV